MVSFNANIVSHATVQHTRKGFYGIVILLYIIWTKIDIKKLSIFNVKLALLKKDNILLSPPKKFFIVVH